MDFSRLTRAELTDYLKLNDIQPSSDLVVQASQLFDNGGDNTMLTTAVVDLYLATEFKRLNPNVNIEQYVADLSPEQERETMEMLGLNPNDPDANQRFSRILRILRTLNPPRTYNPVKSSTKDKETFSEYVDDEGDKVETFSEYIDDEGDKVETFSEYIDDEDIIPPVRTRGLTPEERRTLNNAKEIQERLRNEELSRLRAAEKSEDLSRLRFEEKLEDEDLERLEIAEKLDEEELAREEARLRNVKIQEGLERGNNQRRLNEARLRRDAEQERLDKEIEAKETKEWRSRVQERYYEHLDLSKNPQLQQKPQREERFETRIEPRSDVNYYKAYFGGQRPAEGAVGAREPKRVDRWYDQFKEERKFKEVKVLTLNTCYQCMTGVKGGSVKRACDSSCRNTIRDYINSGPDYDFVALQEATNWETLRSPKLNWMTPVEYKPGVETMVLLYRETLALDSGVSIIKSYLQDINRPMIILFFPNLCVFNIHAGHGTGFFKKKYDFYELDNHLAEILGNARINKPGSRFTIDGQVTDNLNISQSLQVRDRLSTNFIILAGDLNTDFREVTSIKLFQDTGRPDSSWRDYNTRTLTGFHNIPTCCDPQVQTTQSTNKSGAYDQVLVSEPGIVVDHQVPLELKNASDHLPLLVTTLLPY